MEKVFGSIWIHEGKEYIYISDKVQNLVGGKENTIYMYCKESKQIIMFGVTE